jgi:hypothetical protein
LRAYSTEYLAQGWASSLALGIGCPVPSQIPYVPLNPLQRVVNFVMSLARRPSGPERTPLVVRAEVRHVIGMLDVSAGIESIFSVSPRFPRHCRISGVSSSSNCLARSRQG